ncbi:MAG: cysteine--tRNA ligase [Nitrospinae bacterium]|nr:cysteine--tRNA ligase [Nitrospinota bacterium]
MPLKIYNTLTREKEDFAPIAPPKVGMYVCGVTVYDLCHIGHARAGTVFDVIYRYLKFRGYDVFYVRNVTDIDDKIINRANELKTAWNEIAEKYTHEFNVDMETLGLLKPDIEPKATDHIAEMIDIIQSLIAKNHAYESNGSVYFAVKSFAPYGILSGKNLDDLMSGARVEVDETKRDPLDFALWKAAKPGEPFWESPWGKGRPGWHIECSAMGRKYLGETFDIHGGGKDLVFPHHENEIAQSHASSGAAPVKTWVHNGFVTVNEEKMSKSLGNFFTIKDLLKLYHPEALRLFLLSSHYRSPIDFADGYLADAFKNLSRFYDLLAFAEQIGGEELKNAKTGDALKAEFVEMMDDDFNTATAIATLNNELRRLNYLRADMGQLKKTSPDFAKTKNDILCGAAGIRELGGTLGLFQCEPTSFMESAKAARLSEAGLTENEVESLIVKRTEARASKNFAYSDMIRDELAAKGILLQDTPQGTVWTAKFD